ncbi:hypothetical protein XELAEV_18036388mg [Xenopus laevis]|uniref:Uncharacterized protein n=1 Tax=Xenopus laevis TaxID=8355 RepID=A0A974HDE7_XENLA|nr:hypothetical protein XELAEV_18036388mg [Xenopus laevis]
MKPRHPVFPSHLCPRFSIVGMNPGWHLLDSGVHTDLTLTPCCDPQSAARKSQCHREMTPHIPTPQTGGKGWKHLPGCRGGFPGCL